MHRASLLALLFLAGCVGPAADPAPSGSPLTLQFDCANATLTPAAGACVRFLEGGEGRQTEASLAVHPREPGTVLVSWTEWGTSQIWGGITRDGGATWTTTALHDPSLTPLPEAHRGSYDSQAAFLPDGTAVVLYGGEDHAYYYDDVGAVVIAYTEGRMTLARSSDGGATWTYHAFNEDGGVAIGPDFMPLAVAPDTGRMLVAGQAYYSGPSAYPPPPAPGVGDQQIGLWLWSSDDGGKTWSDPRPLYLPIIDGESGLARMTMGADGLVVLTFVRLPSESYLGVYNGYAFMATVSHDGGETWEAPVTIADPPYNMGYGPPVIHADGTIEVVLQGDKEVFRAVSTDVGRTWSKPQPIAKLDEPLFSWAIGAGGPGGELAVLVQTDNVCDPEKPPTRWGVELLRLDGDGALDRRPMVSPLDKRVQPGCHEGNDYAGLAYARDGSLWAAWADPRANETARIAVARLVG